MADYIRSDQPTLTITADVGTESLRIKVNNLNPTGSRPFVASNQIYRRSTGSTGNWTLVATVSGNGSVLDTFQRASTSLDYFVVTDTFSESVTYTATTPFVSGFWAYAAADSSTLAHYSVTDGGTESLDEVEQVLQFVGRTYPVVEAGIQETQTVSTTITVPFSDPDWSTQVEWWRLRKRERRTLLYRDGRRRVFAARIVGPVGITAARIGTTISVTLQRVDYTTSTTELLPAYYVAGIYNEQGNGVSGNGSIGNGY